MNREADCVEKNDCVTWKKLDDSRSVMLDLDSGRYYTLNQTATAIWELMGVRMPIELVVRRLTQMFDVDAATAARDVEELVGFLTDKGFLRRTRLAVMESALEFERTGAEIGPYSKPVVEEHEAVQEIAAAGTGSSSYGGSGSHYWYPN